MKTTRPVLNAKHLSVGIAIILLLAGCGSPKEAKQGDGKAAKQQSPTAASKNPPQQPSAAGAKNPPQQSSSADAENPAPAPVRVEITAAWPGASPEEIEAGLVVPIEMVINSLAELKTVRTDIVHSVGKVTLTFDDGVNADDRLKQTNAALQTIDQLPDGAEDFQLRILPPPRIPPVWVVWKSKSQAQALASTKMRNISDRIARVPFAGEVHSYGVRQPYLEVVVDEDALRRLGVTFEATQAAIDRFQLRLPFKLRSAPKPAKVSDLEQLVLKDAAPPVLLRDVAQVRLAFHDRSRVRWNGQASSAFRVALEANAPSGERAKLEGRLLAELKEWTDVMQLDGGLSVAFPNVGADIRVIIDFPAGSSPTVQRRIVDLARKELKGVLDKRNWLLIESDGEVELYVGQVSEPKLMAAKMYDKLMSLPGVRVSVANLRDSPSPIVARIFGPKLESLRQWSQSVSKKVHGLSGVTGVRILGIETAPELELVIKKELAKRLGLDTATLASRLRPMIANSVMPPAADVERPIVVRRSTASTRLPDISKVKLSLPDGTQVPISELADISVRSAPQSVIRVDYFRSVEVQIQADSRASRQAIQKALPSILSSTRSPDLGSAYRHQID